MYKVAININENGEGIFALDNGGKTLGEIKVQMVNNELILLDTIVMSKTYFQSIANRILQETVEYARMHDLKIVTMSDFAQKQFSRDPAIYADVWEKAS